MKKREAEILKECLRNLKRDVIVFTGGSNEIHRLCVKIDLIRDRIDKWERQKWVASVDEYNECRYDCEPVRLAAA